MDAHVVPEPERAQPRTASMSRLVGNGWLYECGKCSNGTISCEPLKPDVAVRIFCCGKWRRFSLTEKQIANLPVKDRSPRSPFGIVVGMAAQRNDSSDVVYEQSSWATGPAD
jgi:hypothetical protein